jgi:hypothetical protein
MRAMARRKESSNEVLEGERQNLSARVHELNRLRLARKEEAFTKLKKALVGEYDTRRNIANISGVELWRVKKFMRNIKQKKPHEDAAVRKHYVAKFFKQSHISTTCPEARKGSNRYCRETMQSLWKEEYIPFLRQEADSLNEDREVFLERTKLEFSRFAFYRPKEVKMSDKTPARMCVCDDCENVRYPTEALNAVGLRGVPASMRDVIWATCCPFTGQFPKLKCVERKCDDCGVEWFKKKINRLNRGFHWRRQVDYISWETVNHGKSDRLDMF